MMLKQDTPALRRSAPKLAALVAAGALLAATSSAHAVLLLGNSPGVGGSGTNDIFAAQWNSAEISTGAITGGSGYSLDNVVITAKKGSLNSGASAVVEIYDDSGAGGTAGSSLITLGTLDVLGNAFSNLTFTPGSSFILAESTTYWVVVKGAGGSPLDVSGASHVALQTDPNAYTGVAAVVAATNKTQYFCDLGIVIPCATPTWGVSPFSPGGGHDFAYAVSGTAVPEPTTLVLLGLGLAGIGFRRRRMH